MKIEEAVAALIYSIVCTIGTGCLLIFLLPKILAIGLTAFSVIGWLEFWARHV